MNQDIVTLDVRADIREGRPPFARIERAVSELASGQKLLLIAPFKPVPLLDLLAQQGFKHTAERNSSGDWAVLLARQSGVEPPDCRTDPAPGRPCAEVTIITVDARGLEPPQPLVKVLEALAALPAGAELHARTDRRPLHLYDQLENRGFTAQTKEEADGSFLTFIRSR
jgi:uncharacterized protein (DUF2249 family)